MTKSALQIERARYSPKLPKALQGAVKVVTGKNTGEAAAFLKFLKKKEAKKIIEKYGFVVK